MVDDEVDNEVVVKVVKLVDNEVDNEVDTSVVIGTQSKSLADHTPKVRQTIVGFPMRT